LKAGFRVRHPVGDFIEIDVRFVFSLCIDITLERRIVHRVDVRITAAGSSATRYMYVAATSLAEVPALASTLTRSKEQCSLRQQGVYIEYIYTTAMVSSHVASYTRFICTSKAYSHTSLQHQTRWSPTSTCRRQHLTLPAIRSLGDRPLSLNPQSCPKKPDGRSTQIKTLISDV
jgi:hypothetical protein